jgi:hypothetical protein
MTTVDSQERDYFDRAFALAYWIHANKEIAFFIAEDALDELPSMLGNQEKNRKPSTRLSGFWKGGERTRPLRKTIKLNERQMLQWLVYKHSEPWERQTEHSNGLYLPTEEDLIVRYLKHLAYLTLRYSSFYVTLAVGSLLHQFDRRETRLFYDILTQSDSARMKDMGYIGKQRLELLERIRQRFDRLIQTSKTPAGDKQFVMRPTTQWVIELVAECLRRLTPWDTACVVEAGFEVTDIPGFYFSGTGSDEDLIELDRIHTVLEPECFARFVEGLSKYVRTLPGDNQDRGCNYDSLNERLAVPQFSNFPSGPSRGDRFQSPKLATEDYIRLQRTLEARARRRKSFTPQQLCIYVDDALSQSFNLRLASHIQFLIGPEVGVIEVRGRDAVGELTLATLLVEYDQIPMGGAFRDSVVHQGGQKVTIQLTPNRDAKGEVEGAQVEVSYAEPRWLISRLAERVWFGLIGLMRGRRGISERPKPGFAWLVKAGAALGLLVAGLALIWLQLHPAHREVKLPDRAMQSPTAEQKPPAPTPLSTPPVQPPPATTGAQLVARAAWSRDPQSALRAIPIEPTRGEVKQVDLSRRQTQVLLSLPLYDDGRMYSRYRIILAAADKRLWQQTLRAPAVSLTGHAHILNLVLFSRQLFQTGPYDLQVEGWVLNDWRPIGHVLLNPIKQ